MKMKRKDKTQIVQFRRKREGKTNYKKRLALLKSGMPRIVVRKSLNHISGQLVSYGEKGDKIAITVKSQGLAKLGWPTRGNIPSAYLTGLQLGKRIAEKKIKNVIIDIGMQSHSSMSRVYALVKGVADTGIEVVCPEEIFPTEDKIKAKDIAKYAKLLKEKSEEAYKAQFSDYIKKNVDPTSLDKLFEETKNKITGAK